MMRHFVTSENVAFIWSVFLLTFFYCHSLSKFDLTLFYRGRSFLIAAAGLSPKQVEMAEEEFSQQLCASFKTSTALPSI